MNTTNIITSLNVNTQLPLDSKTYVYDFTDLLDLGLNQTKAFTYYIGMKVYCASNESTYIWREYTTPLEAGALIPNGYTYPPGILNDTFDYSNKKFNFFLVEEGGSGIPNNNLIKTSAESIPSYTPVAIYNNQAYKLDNLNPLHQFSFAGFSTNGTSIGENCIIQQEGEISLLAWGLTPDTHYLASNNGAIQLNNTSEGFTKVIGYAITSDTLRIIKEYTTINK